MYLAREIARSVPFLSRSAARIGLVSGFFLAVSPWSLQFSRAAFEVNVAVCITTAAVTFFLIGLRRPGVFLLSALFFGLDLFVYHSARVVSPLLLIVLVLLHHRRIPGKKYALIFTGIYLLFFAAFSPILLSKDAQVRFSATNIFNPGVRWLSDRDLPGEYLQQRQQDEVAGYSLAGKIFHNNRLIYTDYETVKTVARNYVSHFGFDFLFVKSNDVLHHAPGFGLLYIWEFSFLVFGALLVLRYPNRYTLTLIAWILIAPIPAAVTRGSPHAVRTELLLPTFQILIAIAVLVSSRFIIREFAWFGVIITLGVIGLFSANMGYYLHQYYVHLNYEVSDRWLYGRKEAVQITEKLKGDYDRVIISTRLEMPHVFWLFYTRYSPTEYLDSGGTASGGFAEDRNRFDKYEFHTFDYNNLPKDEKILLVGRAGGIPSDFPGGENVIATIPYVDGSPGLIIAKNK